VLSREFLEEDEERRLSADAALCMRSRGREIDEPACPWRTLYQRDRDRILHSKAFRRLSQKTQVFIAPEGDHYRSRLTHTLEVAQVARTISRLLRMNEDLTEAIALGHDLGHTPFGHAGELALDTLIPGGFRHNEQGLRVVSLLERTDHHYQGLNLSWEVRDGILKHTGPGTPATWEGQIVRLADRIAYLNHDIDDAIRAGLLDDSDLPKHEIGLLGKTSSERLSTWISDAVTASTENNHICQTGLLEDATNKLREFMFRQIYIGSAAKREESKVSLLLCTLFNYLVGHPSELPDPAADTVRQTADYIAGMTDRYAVAKFSSIFVPASWAGTVGNDD